MQGCKNTELGATSWYKYISDDHDFKNAGHCPLTTTCSLIRYCNKLFRLDFNSEPPCSLQSPFWWKFGQSKGLYSSINQAIDELGYSWRMEKCIIVGFVNPNFYFNLSFLKIAVGGWQSCADTKFNHRRIYSLYLNKLSQSQTEDKSNRGYWPREPTFLGCVWTNITASSFCYSW